MTPPAYSTEAPKLRPRPRVSLGVWLSGFLVGLLCGFLATMLSVAAP